jgi:hypothetical protein
MGVPGAFAERPSNTAGIYRCGAPDIAAGRTLLQRELQNRQQLGAILVACVSRNVGASEHVAQAHEKLLFGAHDDDPAVGRLECAERHDRRMR